MAETRDQNDRAGAGWRDRLVELHILADNGDAAAAAAAERWCASDPAARQAWDEVASTCQLLLGDQRSE
jgi:hypothetical protein